MFIEAIHQSAVDVRHQPALRIPTFPLSAAATDHFIRNGPLSGAAVVAPKTVCATYTGANHPQLKSQSLSCS
jgi:hypothetical protein